VDLADWVLRMDIFIGSKMGAAADLTLERNFPYTHKRDDASARMITSKITSKAQTTIPQAVRQALRVREGDELAYKIERGRVILTKAAHMPADDPFATFAEWGSDNDQRAYGDL